MSQDTLSFYRFLFTGTAYNRYYVRVFAMNTDGWGPPRLCDPVPYVPKPVDVFLVQAGQNIPLYGGLIMLQISNVGSGPFVNQLPVSAVMANGTANALYNVSVI